MERLGPLDSARWVMEQRVEVSVEEQRVEVSVEEQGVEDTAQMFFKLRHTEDLSPEVWRKTNPLAPDPHSEQAVHWVFVVDTMNFSFWSESELQQCAVTYRGRSYTGYMSLCAAVSRALDEGVPLTDPQFFAHMTLQQLKHVLRSDNDTEMPMVPERHQVLTDAGLVLLRHGGSFQSFISETQNDAEKMVQHITRHMVSYQDYATYKGRQLSFLKRAQILVADYWCVSAARGDAPVSNMEALTMFADYRVPQVLVYLGALKYSEGLRGALERGEPLASGDPREVEIRAGSIWAVERIRQRLDDIIRERDKKPSHVTSVILDFYLWSYAKQHHQQMAHIPIHHTRCIYY